MAVMTHRHGSTAIAQAPYRPDTYLFRQFGPTKKARNRGLLRVFLPEACGLPAPPLVADHLGRYDMLPLDAPRADRILSGLGVTGGKVNDSADILAAAVDVLLQAGKDGRQ